MQFMQYEWFKTTSILQQLLYVFSYFVQVNCMNRIVQTEFCMMET